MAEGLGDSRHLSSLDDLGKLDAITVRTQHPFKLCKCISMEPQSSASAVSLTCLYFS